MERFTSIVALLILYSSCNNSSYCEKHFIPKDFLGKVKIYFNKKNVQSNIDKDGCTEYYISNKGECFSAQPFNEVNRYEDKVFKCFEVLSRTNLKEVPVFIEQEYLIDSTLNRFKKYVFFTSSGYENYTGKDPNYVLEYYIDFGYNYKKY